MQLEDYFDFYTQPVEGIRIKGTRIDIDFVIELHQAGQTPEQIAARYSTADLVQVYASITYYLQNKANVDAYLARRAKIAEVHRQRAIEQQPHSEAVVRIKAIKAAQNTAGAP